MYSVAKETAMDGQNKLLKETMKNHFHLSGKVDYAYSQVS